MVFLSSLQLSKIDARIMRVIAGMHQLEVKLDRVSAYDYRSILVPLLKSYMRVGVRSFSLP